KNVELTMHLNPGLKSRWIAVDNTLAGPGACNSAVPGVEILPGVPRPRARDKGSLHHAMALEKALHEVRTRFVLFMDPDFFVIRANWVEIVLSHVAEQGLGIFGSVWHPRWFYQYRNFPSVHFMLVDLHQIPLTQVDLKPLISDDRWWQIINRDRTPWPRILRDTLKAQRCRDTGWQIYRRYRDDPAISVETLLPHYVPPEDARYKWERRLAPLLRESWRKYPDSGTFTEESFVKAQCPQAYAQAWEEFFWREAPFAIHLRRVGRSMANLPLGRDDALFRDFLNQVVN
ncbi:MAG: hypothetical protein ACRD5Z_16975, partial [Bryobacteraceae bacterium]